MNGARIFQFLCTLKLEFQSFDWLEERGLSEFEILISVILTQNTNWNNVLKALANVKKAQITTLQDLNALETSQIAQLIKPSGFYNTKAKRLKGFLNALTKDFEDLAEFKAKVSREWLLSVKGLGFESVDSILNYLCKREILVVDSYTQRLAFHLGYEFEHYDELREFFQSGVESEQVALCECLGKKCELYELYQIFHAQIIAFGKKYFKGKSLNDEGKALLAKLQA